ncbi:MAG: glycogen debranching protein GlgX, partial [Methylobacteriaceae bacterium]|nr:glycogen debranching protein GlgX [Methylobacteriaceae bacterium]
MTRRVGPGAPEPLGLTFCEGGANVAVVSSAETIELCLFDEADRECERLLLPTRFGAVWCGFVEGLEAGQRYGLRAHGPFAPARGLRFDARKLLVDPYALALDRPFALHPSLFSHGADADADSAPVAPKAIAIALQAAPPGPRASRPWRDAIIYELHVKGFTQRLEAVPPADRGTFRGLAHPAAISHLVELGVTIVELMPCAAWIDERHLPALGLSNYWGYNPIAFMAPDPRLAPAGWVDVRAAVDALRAAGIETIVDVVLNHSGESDEFGPTVSLRGLDNALYYRLRADDAARYDNDAGCGNVLALDRAAPLRLAMDALRAWANYGGVDGFRFDLATTLARRADGFDPEAPFLAALAQDPQLRKLRLIAEPWDIGPGGYRPGAFPAAFGEWNDAFRDIARRLWRGDRGLVGDMATRLAGSADRFAAKRPSRSVNFVTAHDGFTLADLVAFSAKRNAANGEDNRDGADHEIGWSNGVEGASDDPAILAARRRDARALLGTLLLSRGTPMLSMGDELGRTQGGNNNAYAQDNATSWIDWAKADAALLAFTRRLVGLRKAHPALTRDAFLDGAPLDGSLVPDVQWLRPDGADMRAEDWPQAQALIASLYAPAEEDRPADRVCVALNPSRDDVVLQPPTPRPGFVWTLALDSAAPEAQARPLEGACSVAARSVALLVERSDARPAPRGVDSALLDRLARAAGIAPDWSAIDGSRHVVSDATKRALLTGLRLPCDSAAEARESLGHLADLLDRRATPLVAAARPGAPCALRLPIGRSRPRALLVQRDDGETIAVALREPRPVRWRARDGRLVEGLEIEAPALPQGRARLTRDDAPDVAATLIVADRAHIPDRLRRERAAGLAAQLYSLSGAGGVGDFAVLADLGARSGRAGLATVGLNPLHALFPQQPERASPYHPSDRRFLDWLYVDCGAAVGDQSRRLIDYGATRAAKAATLDAAHRAFAQQRLRDPQAPEVRDFADFVAQGGDALFRFACFETLTALRPERDWRDWPAPLRRGDSEALAAFARQNAAAIEA